MEKHINELCLKLSKTVGVYLKRERIRLSVIQFNRKYMKLTKFGILVNKTTSMFTSIRDSNISWGCAKILEIPEGSGGKFGDDFGKSRG